MDSMDDAFTTPYDKLLGNLLGKKSTGKKRKGKLGVHAPKHAASSAKKVVDGGHDHEKGYNGKDVEDDVGDLYELPDVLHGAESQSDNSGDESAEEENYPVSAEEPMNGKKNSSSLVGEESISTLGSPAYQYIYDASRNGTMVEEQSRSLTLSSEMMLPSLEWKLHYGSVSPLAQLDALAGQSKSKIKPPKGDSPLVDTQFLVNLHVPLALAESVAQKLKYRNTNAFATSLQVMSSYQDVEVCVDSLPNQAPLQDAYLVHCLSHVLIAKKRSHLQTLKLKKRRRKQKDAREEKKSQKRRKRLNQQVEREMGTVTEEKDQKMKMEKDSKEAEATGEDEELVGEDPLPDMGFTRPRILILTATKHTAFSAVNRLLQLLPTSMTAALANKRRYVDVFGPVADDDGQMFISGADKPADWRSIFGGNTDDCFVLGCAVSAKSSSLLCSPASSDIIVASPLGLRLKGGKVMPFLSSVEIVVVEQSYALTQQNLDHLSWTLRHINVIPSSPAGIDFTRVWPFALDGCYPRVRQCILLAEGVQAALLTEVRKACSPMMGRCRLMAAKEEGILSAVTVRSRVVFCALDIEVSSLLATSALEGEKLRWQWIEQQLIPDLKDEKGQKTMVVVRDSLDTTRLRPLLDALDVDYTLLDDGTPADDISRARSDFYHQLHSVLVTTERFHFYHRYSIRGARRIIFIRPPQRPSTLLEYAGMLPGPSHLTTVAYTKYDFRECERLVGSNRLDDMLLGEKSLYLFT
jgi:U3 small nucleolar RNA-associated protein 25